MKLKKFIKKSLGETIEYNLIKEIFLISIFYTFEIAAVFLFKFCNFTLDNFKNRIISQGTMAGIDINLRVTFFYKFIFILVLLLAIVYLIMEVIYLYFKKAESKFNLNFSYERKYISVFAFIGICQFIIKIFGSNVKYTLIVTNILIAFSIIVMVSKLIIALKKSINELEFFNNMQLILIWIPIEAASLLISIIFFYHYKFSGQLKSKIFAIFYLVLLILLLVISNIIFNQLKRKMFNDTQIVKSVLISFFPIFIVPIVFSFLNELYIILNQHNIYILHPTRINFLIFILSFILMIFFIFEIRKKNLRYLLINNDKGEYSFLKKCYYPLFIILITLIIYQPPISIGPPTELFESGNSGLAIHQLFNFGKIPIVESFNAHFLSELFGGIIFSLLNGFQGWAFTAYSNCETIINIIIIYYFLNNVIDQDISFLIILFFPFLFIIIPNYYAFSLIGVLILIKLLKNTDNIRVFVIFWILIGLILVWRIDLGFASILAAITVYVMYKVVYRERVNFKRFFITGIIVFLLYLSVFCIIALIKRINPIFRINELLQILQSNQVWGYTGIGNSKIIKFSIYYIVFPILTLFIGIFIFIKSIYNKKEIDRKFFAIIEYLVFFQIFNFQRALVRHSLAEQQDCMVYSFAFLLIAFIVYYINFNKSIFIKISAFVLVSIICTCLIYEGVNSNKLASSCNFESALVNYSKFNNYIPSSKKVNRYIEPDQYKQEVYGDFEKLLNITLNKNETFLDFSNEPYLYVLTNRITPMYINQTPAFLSNEILQNYYLDEIRKYSAPYVVYSSDKQALRDLDGVPDRLRNYRVSEYIYSNYEPFVKVNNLNIWVDKKRKAEFEKKISNIKKNYEVSINRFLYNNSQNKIKGNDCSLKLNSDNIDICSNSGDPYIYNVFPYCGIDKFNLAQGKTYSVEVEYSSKINSSMQAYFLLNNNMNFNEKDSIKFNVVKSNRKAIVRFPIKYSGILKDIRFDLPNNDEFKIWSIKLYSESDVYPITENIESKFECSELNIGLIPYYWGEKDSLNAVNKTKIVDNLCKYDVIQKDSINIYNLDKRVNVSGKYIHILAEANTKTNIKLSYGIGNNSYGDVKFILKGDGKYHNYLIRISCDYNWNKYSINKISILPDSKINIKDLNIRNGD